MPDRASWLDGRRLLTVAAYARRRGVTKQTVWRRTVPNGGPIPVHGRRKLIDPPEADAIWDAISTPTRAANRAAVFPTPGADEMPKVGKPDAATGRRGPARDDPEPLEPPPPDGGDGEIPSPTVQLVRARADALVVDVETKRLALEQRRGALMSRTLATTKAFSFARTIRDACQTWPAKIGPQLAAQFDLDAAHVTVFLEDHVRALLADLASERAQF